MAKPGDMLVQLLRAERGEEVLDDIDWAEDVGGQPPDPQQLPQADEEQQQACPGEVNPGREQHARFYGTLELRIE